MQLVGKTRKRIRRNPWEVGSRQVAAVREFIEAHNKKERGEINEDDVSDEVKELMEAFRKFKGTHEYKRMESIYELEEIVRNFIKENKEQRRNNVRKAKKKSS